MRAPISMMIFLLASVNVCARADDTVIAAAKPVELTPVPDGGIYLGGGGGATPDGQAPMLNGSVLIDRQLFWRLGAMLSGEWSYIFRNQTEDTFTLRLCIGVRLDLWRSDDKKVRIITDVAFVHQHESTVSNWLKFPFENALGESKYGLGHRSGVEVGGGILLTPFNDSRNWFARRVRGLIRVSGVWLPDSLGSNVFVSLLTSVGVAL